ncbi:sensor histidine kinase [Flavobacterium sp.]|uniref:sensor histidine kinase n=1 Tax=Flavobacterium sp. TaxID=239 RepID=UPI00352779E9
MESPSEVKILFWLGTSVMLLLTFGLLSLVMFYQKQFLKSKQLESERLLKAILDSEKKERQRIAQDLHDGVQSDLRAISNYFLLLSRKIKEEQLQSLLKDTRNALEDTIESTRFISYKLMPPLIEIRGFVMAVQDYFERLSKSSNKKFSLQDNVKEIVVSDSVGYELFRIVQEFTSNMLKYGSIQECKLFFYEINNRICLELVDDGVPFDFMSSYKTSFGSGLQNIQSRLKSIHATLEQRKVVTGNHFVIYLPKEL